MKSVLAITSQILTFILVCVSGKGEKDATLTTAIFRDDNVSLKPTTLYRRIAVDRNVEDKPSTSADIFNHRIKPMRRNRADIWNWDYWCQLQSQKGNCSKKLQKYYYNTHLDKCLTFTFTGCKANKNNFDTLVECERHCKGAAYMVMKQIDRSTSCSLQPNAGLCVALFTKYYYDVNDGTCKNFVYGGCGGNQNRFPTKYKCLKKCRNKNIKNSFQDKFIWPWRSLIKQ